MPAAASCSLFAAWYTIGSFSFTRSLARPINSRTTTNKQNKNVNWTERKIAPHYQNGGIDRCCPTVFALFKYLFTFEVLGSRFVCLVWTQPFAQHNEFVTSHWNLIREFFHAQFQCCCLCRCRFCLYLAMILIQKLNLLFRLIFYVFRSASNLLINFIGLNIFKWPTSQFNRQVVAPRLKQTDLFLDIRNWTLVLCPGPICVASHRYRREIFDRKINRWKNTNKNDVRYHPIPIDVSTHHRQRPRCMLIYVATFWINIPNGSWTKLCGWALVSTATSQIIN